MKTLGLRIGGNGSMSVTKPSKVEDAIWEAVELAIDNGWTPEQFKSELADAWAERLRDDAKRAVAILSK
jgi:hypothetical protein